MAILRLSEWDGWPGCHEVALEGELDLTASGELAAALNRAVTRRDHVLLDLTACEFIDAGGISVLVRGHERLRHRGRQLLLIGVHGQVRRLLSMTGLMESELIVMEARSQARRLIAAGGG
jgi:anti-anti-sigma factor